jgi:DNA-binding XRE family transcriptional regulator
MKNTSNAKEVFRRNISLVRRVKRISQETMGEIADLHRTYIGQIERGEVTPTLDAAERISCAIGLELWELLKPDFSIDAILRK